MPVEAVETVSGKAVFSSEFREALIADTDRAMSPTLPSALHKGDSGRLVADHLRVSCELEREANRRRLDLWRVV